MRASEARVSDEPNRTVVLLGAGASRDAGLPTATEIHDKLKSQLPQLYSDIARWVFGNDTVDIERLFVILAFVHSLELEDRPEEMRLNREDLSIRGIVEAWHPELEMYLKTQAHATGSSPSGLMIDDLWETLSEILWVPTPPKEDLTYLLKLLLALRGSTIVTLNYDNALEVASKLGVGCPLEAGPTPWTSGPIPGQPARSDRVRLVKLHGSLDWDTNQTTGHVSVVPESELAMWNATNGQAGPNRTGPSIIFGAGNKLRPAGPYLDLFYEFKQALFSARRVIVVGYSFLDTHVNELLRHWVRSNDGGRRLLRVNWFDPSTKPPFVDSWFDGHPSSLQIHHGSAKSTMNSLLAPSPELFA